MDERVFGRNWLNKRYMETQEPCAGCDGLGRWVVKDEPSGQVWIMCATCGRDMTIYPVEPDGDISGPATYGGQPCPIPFPKEEWEEAINDLVSAKREIDRLAAYILQEIPREIGRGSPRTGEGAVDIAIRLIKRLRTLDSDLNSMWENDVDQQEYRSNNLDVEEKLGGGPDGKKEKEV